MVSYPLLPFKGVSVLWEVGTVLDMAEAFDHEGHIHNSTSFSDFFQQAVKTVASQPKAET